jgi:hypothetical protein
MIVDGELNIPVPISMHQLHIFPKPIRTLTYNAINDQRYYIPSSQTEPFLWRGCNYRIRGVCRENHTVIGSNADVIAMILMIPPGIRSLIRTGSHCRTQYLIATLFARREKYIHIKKRERKG